MEDETFLGLATLVRPIYFERATHLLVSIAADYFKVRIDIDPEGLDLAASDYRERAVRLLRPTVVNVLDTYVHAFARNMKLKAEPTSYWLERPAVAPDTLRFCRYPVESAAVLAGAYLFMREVPVDFTKCHVEMSAMFLVAHQLRRKPSLKMFEVPPLNQCHQVDGARRSVA
jgi:hypothetical protein